MPYYLAYVLNSYQAIGSVSNPLSDFFQEPYAAKIPGLFDGMHSGGEINAELTRQIPLLVTSDFRTSYATNVKYSGLRSVIKSNSVVAWSLSTPTKLFHGADDEYVPVGVSSTMYADFLAKDANNKTKLELVTIPLTDHSTAIPFFTFSTLSWFIQINSTLTD
jgi:hypothetical protein